MNTARERLRLQNIGREAEANASIDANASELANQRIAKMVEGQQAERMKASRDKQFIDEARMQGQTEGADAVIEGLGMGSQTVEGMQQLDQVSQESLVEAATPYVGQAMEALHQGMDPRKIDAMISESVEPELQSVVRQMLGQEMEDIKMQQASQQQQGSQGVPQAPPSAASDASNAILTQGQGQGIPQQ